jgi:DNA-binding IclR family transcriptional regulator
MRKSVHTVTIENEPLAPNPAPSPVERAFRVLRFIAEGGSTSNLSEISRQLQLNRITVMRLLESLETAGLIAPVSVNGVTVSHQIGMNFLTLAASALGSFDLTARAKQIMPDLAKTTGLSAYLVVRDGSEVVYLLRETPDTPLVSRIKVGSRLPAHTATSGLVLLATMAPAALKALYADNAKQDAPADFAALTKAIESIREHGCAWSFSGLEAGINSCAAAVLDSRGTAIAALSLAGPSGQFSGSDEERQHIEQALKTSADALSRSQP